MMRRLFGFAGILGVLAVAACSAADPGVDGLTRSDHLGQQAAGPGADGGGGGTPGKDGGGSPGADGGSKPAMDAAMAPDTAMAMTDGFTGSGAYASNKPAMTAAQHHMNNGVGVTPSKDTACLGCHGPGGSGKEFLFAGSVFQDKAATMPAADTEVRVRGNDGVAFLTSSDDDGNFWYVKGAMDKLASPSQTGARTAANTSLMSGTISDTNCNGCHNGGGTDPMHVP